MPKCSCSASFRSVLREDPDLKHPEQEHLRTGVGMTNKNEIEPVPNPFGQVRTLDFHAIVAYLAPTNLKSQPAIAPPRRSLFRKIMGWFAVIILFMVGASIT